MSQYHAIVDLGTSTTKISLVNATRECVGSVTEQFGVRDLSRLPARARPLLDRMSATMERLLQGTGCTIEDVGAVLAFGMITSELGLEVVPHIVAPAGRKDLARNLVQSQHRLFNRIPVYLIPGIRNSVPSSGQRMSDIELHDFMRGEETQAIGVGEKFGCGRPLTVVFLSSHSKYVSMSSTCEILGSLTTVSGQLFRAIVEATSIGKSVADWQSYNNLSDFLRYEEVIALAERCADVYGLLRCLLIPRIMDVLLDNDGAERLLFLESALLYEDLKCFGSLAKIGFTIADHIVVVGDPLRSRLFQYLLKRSFRVESTLDLVVDEQARIDLGIQGALSIAETAGIIAAAG